MSTFTHALSLVVAFGIGIAFSTVTESHADSTEPARKATNTHRFGVDLYTAPNNKGSLRKLAQGKNASLAYLSLAAGAEVPDHQDATEEYLYVLSGEGKIWIDGKQSPVVSGSTVFMPAGAKVSFKNGKAPFTAVQVFAGPAPGAKYSAWKRTDRVDAFHEELAGLEKDGRLRDLGRRCALPFAKSNKAVKKACDGRFKRLHEEFTKTLEDFRDGKTRPLKYDTVFRRCIDLKLVAKPLGSPQLAAAKLLCTQARLGERVLKATEAAAKELAKRNKDDVGMPWECETALNEVALASGDWKKKARERLADSCFRRLGVAILAHNVPTLTRCTHRVKKVMQKVAVHRIKGKALDAWVEKAQAKCASF